ncbi:hypothetical protein [Sphingobium lactosutens]|nr:hypothetical protein [Sphingobium lactosutens]
MMKITVATLLAALALSGCGGRENEARKIAAHDLLDPNAAQFRKVEPAGENCFAGEINAKNKVGAYTGFRPFLVDLRKGEVAIAAEPPSDQHDSDAAISLARYGVFAADCGVDENLIPPA